MLLVFTMAGSQNCFAECFCKRICEKSSGVIEIESQVNLEKMKMQTSLLLKPFPQTSLSSGSPLSKKKW